MASLWFFTIFISVVLASTTSCHDQSMSVPGTLIVHTSQRRGATASGVLGAISTAHASVSRGMLVTKQPLAPSPWLNYSSTTTTYPTSQGSNRPTATVIVGESGKLVFSPPTLNATVGSVVSFNFLGTNHTLTQSEFRDPCNNNGGFDTGFSQFNPANTSGRFVVDYEVLDSAPRWFSCAQTANRSHCQAGMVFSLNAHGRHAQFLENALAAVTDSSAPTASACQFPPQKTNISSHSTGTASAGFGNSSGVVSPPISNSGGASMVSYAGLVLALVSVVA